MRIGFGGITLAIMSSAMAIGCGESRAEAKMRRCASDAQSTYDNAMIAVSAATDKGSVANKIATHAAEQAQAYTLSECMKRD